MKKKLSLLIASLFLGTGSLFAQDYLEDPKWGADPGSREQNVRIFNFFNDAVTMKDYDVATVYLRQLIEGAPTASTNVYIKGVDIYRQKIQRAQSRNDRNMFVDSLLWIYDKRIEAFGSDAERGEAAIRLAKARDFMTLMPNDAVRIRVLAKEALDAGNLDPDLTVYYFNGLVESFKLDDVTADELLTAYNEMNDFLAGCDNAAEAIQTIEQLFAASGAASCENIEKIFRPQYEADPENTDLIEKILGLYQRGSCSTDFQMTLLEKYYAVNPKPELAMQLAAVFEGREDFRKAMEYLQTAQQNVTDSEVKTALLIQLAGTAYKLNSYREAAGYAQQVIANDPNNAYGYFFLANAYAGGSSSACSAFDLQTAYWLVVDNLQRARNLTDDQTLISQINTQIGSYTRNFPKTEETFMRGLEPGQSYTVNCGWISGRTTVRER